MKKKKLVLISCRSGTMLFNQVMLFDDYYKTISAPSEGIFREKGSKFMAYAYPLKSEEEFKSILTRIKSEHPKANHHCWALRLTTDRSVFRLNDDGEPSGTAGRPILNTLLSLDLTDLGIIVVRYFGGTLLGVPGLIHAYKAACADALNNTKIIEKTLADHYRIEFDYLQINEVMKIVKEENLRIDKQQFDNLCLMEIAIPKSKLNSCLAKLGKISGLKPQYLFTI